MDTTIKEFAKKVIDKLPDTEIARFIGEYADESLLARIEADDIARRVRSSKEGFTDEFH